MSQLAPTHAPTLWEQGREPGREVAALTAALLLTVAAIEILVDGRLGLLTDLVFIALCGYAALSVRPRDFFTVGVLPPLALAGIVALLAITRPGAVATADDNAFAAVVQGLSAHATALVIGYAAALAILAVRRRVLKF
ncbi:DUF6542 domain-containing protein [Nocardioides montaniterrae]